MVSTGRIGDRGDVHGVRGRTAGAGGETGAAVGVAASGQGTVRRARSRASGAARERSAGARALGGALLRRLSSLGRPATCCGPRPWALRLASVGLIALAGLAALASATPAQAQTTFVSNIGQADRTLAENLSSTSRLAQQFTTGSDERGYRLAEVVVVNVTTGSPASPQFALYSSNSSGEPDTKIADLNGSIGTASGEVSFTPGKTVILRPSTEYFVEFRAGTPLKLRGTTSDDEDSGSAAQWSIDDDHLWWSGSTSTWNHIGQGQSIKMAIKGKVNTVITGTAVTSTPSRSYDTYGAGEKIKFTVTFNGPVDVTGSPKLPIVVLTKIRYATYESGSGTSELVFAYTVREDEWDNNGVLAPPTHRRTSIKLTGGDAIRTSGTNEDAILSTIDISGPSHRVKTDPAWTGDIFVSNLGKTSESTSAAATTGSRMAIAQRFTTRGAGTLRAVRIDGSFSTNSSATNVSIFSADGALGTPGSNLGVLQNPGTLHSTAQVHEFRAAAAGVALAANTTYYVRVAAVQGAVKRTTDNGEDGAWGWTLADAYHAQASSSWTQQSGALRLALLGTSSAAPPAAPRVSGKPVVDTPGRDCAWTLGEAVEVTLAFSEAVTVDTTGGTPTLKLQLGFQDDRTATYLSGNDTTALVFSYTITAADGKNLSMNVPQNGLRLNGGTIQSTSTGADARIAHDHGNFGARPKGKCAPPEGRGFLVGNLAMSDYLGASLSEIDSGFAQSFRPGGERTLRRVVLHGRFSTTSQVSIYSDSSGLPGTSLATLVNPTGLASTLSDLDNHTFSAEGAGGVALSAGTTYWVVLEGAGHVRVTTETGEDGLSGWSIGDNGAFRSTGESSWNPAPSRVFRMALYGVLPPADPPTVVGAPFIPRHPPCYECSGIWKPGRGVEVRLTFSEPVSVIYRKHYKNRASKDTKPTLDIQMGGLLPTRTATYWRGSGTRTLVFGYWVAAADGAHNSVSVAPNSLKLNGGEIYSPSSGLAADLAHEGVGEIRKTFVSNLGETAEPGTVSVSSSITAYAQPFTTGTGGTLRAVRITGAFSSTSQVSIYSDSSGSPGSSVKTLSTPGSAADLVSTQQFDAGSDGLALTASTTYWIVVEGYGLLKFTAQSGESGESGWSLGDSYSGLSGGSWAEASPARAMQVAVLGVAGGGAPAQAVDPPTGRARRR